MNVRAMETDHFIVIRNMKIGRIEVSRRGSGTRVVIVLYAAISVRHSKFWKMSTGMPPTECRRMYHTVGEPGHKHDIVFHCGRMSENVPKELVAALGNNPTRGNEVRGDPRCAASNKLIRDWCSTRVDHPMIIRAFESQNLSENFPVQGVHALSMPIREYCRLGGVGNNSL